MFTPTNLYHFSLTEPSRKQRAQLQWKSISSRSGTKWPATQSAAVFFTVRRLPLLTIALANLQVRTTDRPEPVSGRGRAQCSHGPAWSTVQVSAGSAGRSSTKLHYSIRCQQQRQLEQLNKGFSAPEIECIQYYKLFAIKFFSCFVFQRGSKTILLQQNSSRVSFLERSTTTLWLACVSSCYFR